MLSTSDNQTLIISESFTGRLIVFDLEADGCLSNRRVWAESPATFVHTRYVGTPAGAVVRVCTGGEMLQRIAYDGATFAAMLGGLDQRTLFLLAAEWP
jgi:sugar lactone lactonase YvrE